MLELGLSANIQKARRVGRLKVVATAMGRGEMGCAW